MKLLFAALVLTLVVTQSLSAASVDDLVGEWTVDTALTWEKLQGLPQLSALTAEQKASAKDMLVAQLATVQFTFTTTTLVSNAGGQNKSETFKIIATTDAGLTCESTDEQGAVTRSLVKPSGNTLSISNLADPTQVIILKRK